MTNQTQTAARRPLKGLLQGAVTSDKRHKTRTVLVSYQMRHSKYGKYIRRQTKYQVHDPENQSGLGDVVQIASCRPISKTKSWRLVRVISQAPRAEAPAQPADQTAQPADQ